MACRHVYCSVAWYFGNPVSAPWILAAAAFCCSSLCRLPEL